MNFVNMFSVPLFHVKVDQWDSKKEELLSLIGNMEYRQDQGECVPTDYFESRTKNNIHVRRILDRQIEMFLNHYKLDGRLTSSWFERSGKHHYHQPHNHGMTGYSGVLYVEYDPGHHAPTHFISPFPNFIDGEAIHQAPFVTEGDLILFPSSILHYTHPNKSEKNRTVLSFNLELNSREG